MFRLKKERFKHFGFKVINGVCRIAKEKGRGKRRKRKNKFNLEREREKERKKVC